MTTPKVTIIIPTLNSADYVLPYLTSLRQQTQMPDEVLIIDSASEDGSVELWRNQGCRVISIDRAEFDHGGTRNLGAQLAQEADILVFMTQDAIPANDHWLENLLDPLRKQEAVATFARQLPRPEATLMERFARYFNYPSRTNLRSLGDVPLLGIKTFFFSNVCSAVRADAFWAVQGFPERVILNEDMILAAKLMKAGYKTQYASKSEVLHSHNYTLSQQFKRSFDIGVSLADAAKEFQGASVNAEGVRFLLGQANYVVRHKNFCLLARVILEAAARFAAFHLGKYHNWIPTFFKKRLSMHNYYWIQVEEQK